MTEALRVRSGSVTLATLVDGDVGLLLACAEDAVAVIAHPARPPQVLMKDGSRCDLWPRKLTIAG